MEGTGSGEAEMAGADAGRVGARRHPGWVATDVVDKASPEGGQTRQAEVWYRAALMDAYAEHLSVSR